MSLAELHQKAPRNLKSSKSAAQLSSLKLAQIEKSISDRAMVVEGLHGTKISSSRPLKSDSSSASSSHTKLRTHSDSNQVRLLNCNNIWSWHGPPSLCAIISLVDSSVYGKLIHYQDN